MADKNIKVIHQFLMDHNLENTAEVLIQEVSKMGFQNSARKLKATVDPYAQLILCYNTGDYSTFFQLWKDLFPNGIKQCEEYKKFTFYLHVHFAILPKRKFYADQYKEHEDSTLENCKENNATEIEKNINNSMKQLQDYLNGDGKELENDIELQSFYALPFIEDIHADTFFSKILEQSWMDELSRNLNLFIKNHKQDLIDLNNINLKKVQSRDLVHTMPVTEVEMVESDAARNKIIKNNTLIVPNDRDIPIFLEDHDDEEQYSLSHKTNRNLKSKDTQTHITGDQIIIKNSREDTLNSGENVNSLLKMHKLDKKLGQCNQELVLTKTHLCSVHTNYEKLKVRFHKLHADYHKLINVAGELTVALENSVKGQTVDIQRTLEICMKIFPDLFNQNIRETSYPSLLQFGQTDVKTIARPKVDQVAALSVSPKLLDYKKIKLHLLNGDVKTKLLLLQALRWKITLAQLNEQDEVLHEYISHDLMGLHGQIASDSGKPILPCLLTVGEAYARHLLQQFTARLLNTLASFRCGRDYLSVGSTVVNVIFVCLDSNNADGVDVFACDMMVAMLQKLSLRRQQRIYMIENGLLEWLINHLHNKCRLISLYRLEYATALLMNLSLHRLAQARASKISSLLVSTLLILLSIDHASSLPYINGALNNFLNNPVINEEAKKIKCSNISDYLSNNQKTAEIRKHLEHILKIQRCENVNTPQTEETGDDDNEELDVLENELDENDPLQNYVGELNGETLLAMCYSVSSKIPQDTITTDTTLQKISTLNPINFYDNQHNNYLCSKRPAYPALSRYNMKMENKMLSKKSSIKLAALAKQVSKLSNSSLKEQQSINGTNKESLSADKIENIAKRFVSTKSSLIMKYESRQEQYENLNILKNIVWSSSTIKNKNHNQYEFNCNNRVDTNNMQMNQLKLRRSQNKIDAEKFYDGKCKITEWEKLPLKPFKRNFFQKTILNDTICLYKNQTSKDSSETAITSSVTVTSGRENSQMTETEKFSSIASL
ncbi:lisH domain-containing protein ARMC9-like [Nylanderia fulva]|uniref:lisH domain-containing protein ARMC9-like n=1 Tax=Nylanderia fulva TaxID=613905 RepID=UPI0010FAF47E|nr:lisH domain-containing protein ARMC9-like [Nylanderia fulva]